MGKIIITGYKFAIGPLTFDGVNGILQSSKIPYFQKLVHIALMNNNIMSNTTLQVNNVSRSNFVKENLGFKIKFSDQFKLGSLRNCAQYGRLV